MELGLPEACPQGPDSQRGCYSVGVGPFAALLNESPVFHKGWPHHYLPQRAETDRIPHRNADAPTFSHVHETTVMAKPHEEAQLFEQFLTYIIRQERDQQFSGGSEVRYAQTRQRSLTASQNQG